MKEPSTTLCMTWFCGTFKAAWEKCWASGSRDGQPHRALSGSMQQVEEKVQRAMISGRAQACPGAPDYATTNPIKTWKRGWGSKC